LVGEGKKRFTMPKRPQKSGGQMGFVMKSNPGIQSGDRLVGKKIKKAEVVGTGMGERGKAPATSQRRVNI